MSKVEKDYWQEIIEMIQYSPEYVLFHLWYSKLDGWAYVSYKKNRVRIDSTQTLYQIKNILTSIK
jgi:hypothetical protein